MFKFILLLTLIALATALPAVPSVDSRTGPAPDKRLIGGSAAVVGSFPAVVSLRTSTNLHFCGGSIINNLWVLTAAHCIVGRATTNTVVVAGTIVLATGGERRVSNRLIIHANYNSINLANDIGVIRLAAPLVMTDHIAQIALHSANIEANVPAVIIGWGRTAINGPVSNTLQFLSTTTIAQAQCVSSWGNRVSTSHICTTTTATQGACQGDFGGPLLQAANSYQIGIASFGANCAQGIPDVHIRISTYFSWIANSIAS